MNKTETVQVITLLAGNYDSIAKKDPAQKQLMINTWLECLGDLEYKVVLQAVKKTIIENPYPPTIHEVRKNAIELMHPFCNRSAIEAWNEAYTMICNGLYMSEEEFEKHSPDVKAFFGNVRQVKEQAQVGTDIVNSVTKGQFLKQYEIISSREKEQRLLPKNMQENVRKLVANTNIKMINEVEY